MLGDFPFFIGRADLGVSAHDIGHQGDARGVRCRLGRIGIGFGCFDPALQGAEQVELVGSADRHITDIGHRDFFRQQERLARLLQALRTMPPDSQALAGGRLAHELAMQRVIDKALVARNVLQTGLSLPEVTAAGKVSKDMQEKVDRMTRLIEDFMFEHRIRKEMTSDTALTIMDDATQRDSQAARLSRTQRGESTPVEEGRVRP